MDMFVLMVYVPIVLRGPGLYLLELGLLKGLEVVIWKL